MFVRFLELGFVIFLELLFVRFPKLDFVRILKLVFKKDFGACFWKIVYRQVWWASGLGGVRWLRFGCISRFYRFYGSLSKLTCVYGQFSWKSNRVSRIWDIFRLSKRLLWALVGFNFGPVFVCLYVEHVFENNRPTSMTTMLKNSTLNISQKTVSMILSLSA